MKIGMVAYHACIRVLKEALALKALGHEVHIIAAKQSFGWNWYDSFNIYYDGGLKGERNQFRLYIKDGEYPANGIGAVKALDKIVDVFHVHNEPDSLVPMTRFGTSKPIVFDVHDPTSLRSFDEPDGMEKQAFELADAFVHVSDPCREYCEKHHGNGKPTIVLHPYVNGRFYPEIYGSVSWNSIVYEGGISDDNTVSIDSDGNHAANIRYYGPMVESFAKTGFNVTLFSGSNIGLGHYENLGATFIQKLPYPSMLTGIRPFGFGFVGACAEFPLMMAAMPNKLFEYMSQGVTPVVLCADEAAKFVTENECGVVIDDFADLREKLSHAPDLRKNVIDVSRDNTMEKHIHKLVELYEAVL